MFTFQSTGPEEDLVPARQTWTVMGTILEATVYRPVGAARLAHGDLEAIHDAVLEIDQLMSLYRPESELVALNTHAGAGRIEISAATFQVLQASQHYARLSRGAFDVTIQPLVELWDFYEREETSIPPLEAIQQVLGRVGTQHLKLDVSAQTAALVTDSSVDLGGIAKGYAIDRALAAMRARDVPAALIDLGGNIGLLGQPPGGRPWSVGIKHPRQDSLIGLLRLSGGAVATSGDYDRYFEVEGRRFAHLLDPRTGWPAEGVYAVTVIAPNATAADALSTAAFVLGPEQGMELLLNCKGVEGVLVEPDSTDQVLVRTTLPPREGAVSFVLEPGIAATLQPVARRVELSSISECVWPLGLE